MATFAIDLLSGKQYLFNGNFISGGTGLQQVTDINAVTTVESTFNGGLVAGKIRPTGDTITAIQISKADGTTTVVNIDTISGLTGFGTIVPKGLVHAFGIDEIGTPDGNNTQTNAVIVDGIASVDKDIQWAENGVPKWLAETYRGEDAQFWYLYNVEAESSPLTIMETGRIGVNMQTNIMNSHAAKIVGNGLNDLIISGVYVRNYITVYEIEIVATGTPDTYHWRKSLDNGVTYGAYSPVSGCSLTPIELEFGVFLNFESTTGHTVGNLFQFAAFPQIPQATLSIAPMGFSSVLTTDNYTAPTIIYDDITALANGGTSENQFEIFETGTGGTSQAFYWGTSVQTHMIYFNMREYGTSLTLITEYWNGSIWVAINHITNNYIDGTDNLSRSGRLIWTPYTLTGWNKEYLPNLSGDSHQLYWLRIRTSTNATTTPIAKSVAVGNDRRFGIYNAFNDFNQSVYIDSLGRMNIGGGNITGSNKLQVNTGNNISVTSTGTDSLVEFDSENSAIVDLKIKLASNDAVGPALTFVKIRGTLDISSCTQTGDILGAVKFRGRAGTSGRLLAEIGSQFVGSGTTRCGDVYINTANGSDPVEAVRFNYKGNTGFGITPTAVITLKAGTTTNAPLKFTSGSLLSTPQAGAVEFDGDKTYITTSGLARQTFAFLDSPIFVGSPQMPSGTTFNEGLRINKITALGNCQTGLQINNATGGTLINVNTISGFTGYGTVNPQTLVHLYGTNAVDGDGWNYQTNGIRLDGAFNTDKDIQWATEGQPKFTAQIYRCEEGKFWYLSSQLGHLNQLTVSQAGRVGVNNQTNIMGDHAILEAGGPNDIVVSGLYTQNYTSAYEIEINTISGATDTFRWRVSTDGGFIFGSWSSSILCDYSPYELEFGVNVHFENLTGHTLGTKWLFGAFAQLPIGTFVVTPNNLHEVLQSDNYTLSAITYTNITASANSSEYGGLIDIFDVGETDHAIYFGTLDKLNGIFINLVTSAQGVTLITEYWDGIAWNNLTLINNGYVDGTQNITHSGDISWESNTMTGWIPAYLQDKIEDGYLLYWIRLRTSTNPTVAPTIKSFARNGNYRIAVLASPNDFKPSFYVDSLGRVNMGGGTITGKNQLQINPSNVVQYSPVFNSNVEFDTNTSDDAMVRLKLASNDACGYCLSFVKYRGTLDTFIKPQYGDSMGNIMWVSVLCSSVIPKLAEINAIYTGNGTTTYGDLVFGTNPNLGDFCGGDYGTVEVVRISGSGNTGFGVSVPTARIHIQSGSTTVAPLKFISGSLLSSPQAGAVEFVSDAYYGTITSGTARRTFAFLEAPQFTGNVGLPSTTCLNSVNLCNFILNSGGTNNTTLTTRSDFDAYTASTVQAISKAITGATNGICRANCHDICLGGSLTTHTVLTGNTFNFTISSKCLNLCAAENININSKGCEVNLRGNDTNNVEKLRFMLNSCQIIVTDNNAIPTGIQYANDYSATYSNRSLVDKEYVDNMGGGLNPLAAVMVATTGNTVLSGLTIVDGVQTTSGMRVLVKNQTSGATNGVYSASTGTWGRTSDFDGTPSGEVIQNSFTAILSGNTYAHTSWILNTPNPITVGVTTLTFVLYSASAGVVAGNGICVTQSGGNNVVAVKLPATCSGLCSDVSGLYLNPSVAGNGICLNNGVLSIDGVDIAGNSLSWVANQLAVNTTGGTLNTALNSKLAVSAFNTYSGDTATAISCKLDKSIYQTYTGTTAPAQFANRTTFNTYTGTTAPATYVCKSNFNTYTGATQTAIGLKAPTASPTFTGTVRSVTPTVNDSSTCIATTAWYLGQCATATPLMDGVAAVGTSTLWTKQDHVHPSDTSRVVQTLFNIYTGTTAPATFATKSAINTYTGTTAPAQFVGKTAFNTYSGTTVPNTYVTNSRFNTYTGATNTRLNSKLSLSGGTMTGALNAVKPAQNDNTTCVATTSWYISQGSASNPLMNGSVAQGTSNLFSRQDHVHASDTSRVAKTGDTMTGGLTISSTLNVSGNTKLSAVGACQIVFGSTSRVLTGNTSMVYNPTTCTLCVNYIQSTGANSYYYCDRTGDVTNATATCCKYVGITGTSMAVGTYELTFNGIFGVTVSNNEVSVKYGIDNTVIGKNLIYRMLTASAVVAANVTKNITFSSIGTHCFDVWFFANSGTACETYGAVRVRKIC